MRMSSVRTKTISRVKSRATVECGLPTHGADPSNDTLSAIATNGEDRYVLG